jgi:transcriptional regulator with XRE-family HTH domain
MTWHLFDATSTDEQTRRGFDRIGRDVLRRRQRLGITQRQLELLSGVDQTVISRLENGRLAGLRWSRFARLVDALGGLGETDPHPAWTARLLPPAGARGREHGNHR